MPRLKNPHKHKTVHTLHQPPLRPIDRIALQRLLPECLLAVEVHRVRDGFVANPVADPVCVTGPKDDGECMVVLEEGGECWEGGAGVFSQLATKEIYILYIRRRRGLTIPRHPKLHAHIHRTLLIPHTSPDSPTHGIIP